MEKTYVDRFWDSPDGLKLHFRDYPVRDPAGEDRTPIMCLHGLTRNARDFAGLAEHLSASRRVLVPDMRGRGESEYAKDSATYNPLNYVGDVLALLEQEEIDKFVSVGTSLGGLMTMLMASMDNSKIAAAVLNDIGPVIDPEGINGFANMWARAQLSVLDACSTGPYKKMHSSSHRLSVSMNGSIWPSAAWSCSRWPDRL